MGDQAVFLVKIDGQPVSESFNQILQSIDVTDKAGATSDRATITLDDNGGQVLMPEKGAPLSILLGWRSTGPALVFDGIVDEPRSRGSRGDGRVLSISAKGFDANGKAKQQLEFHKDKMTLQGFLSEAAQRAGLKGVRIASSLATIERDYWAATSESFIHLGHRLAREVGGTFKIVGNTAIIADRNGGQSVSGQALPTITATWPGNLINWDISPTLTRPRYGKSRARWFDVKQGKWREIDVDVDQPGEAPAEYSHRYPRGDEDEATHTARSNKKSSERNRGAGHVLMLGEPAAQPEGLCIVEGTRPGIDGTYRIDQVHHTLSRSAGFQTNCGLKQPQGDAGKDRRPPPGGKPIGQGGIGHA